MKTTHIYLMLATAYPLIQYHIPDDQNPGNTSEDLKTCKICFFCTYRVSQEEWIKLQESVPYVKLYRYNPKHLCPKLNGFRDNGK